MRAMWGLGGALMRRGSGTGGTPINGFTTLERASPVAGSISSSYEGPACDK